MAEEISRVDRATEPLLRWVIPEYTQHERGRNWYIVAGLIAGFFLVYAIATANFLFAVIVLLGLVTLFVRHQHAPMNLEVAIYQDGIAVGERHFEWKELKDFWIVFHPPEVKTLYISFQNGWRPRLPIPLEDTNPMKVRQELLVYLEEDLDREDEPTMDALSRLLKI